MAHGPSDACQHPGSHCQYPVRAGGQFRAIRVSSPWLTGRQYPMRGCPDLALDWHRLTAVPPADPRDQRPTQRIPGLKPPESQRTRGPSHDCPASPASGRLHHQPGPRPAKRPPPRRRVRQEPIPTQARASATGASSTGPQNKQAAAACPQATAETSRQQQHAHRQQQEINRQQHAPRQHSSGSLRRDSHRGRCRRPTGASCGPVPEAPSGGGAGLGRDRLMADWVARWRALGRAVAGWWYGRAVGGAAVSRRG